MSTPVLWQRRSWATRVRSAWALANAAALFGLLFLGWILWTLLSKGLASLNLDLFTMDQPPPMERGGMRNAIVGSLMMCAMGIAIGTPLGIAARG